MDQLSDVFTASDNRPKYLQTSYPIAEKFTSFQGEGIYTGTVMEFIRLAGCNVGKPYKSPAKEMLPVYTEQCTLYDGRQFPCDTNYRMARKMTVSEIINDTNPAIDHFCITGGEPGIHDLAPLVCSLLLVEGNKVVHIETSGTKDIREVINSSNRIWVTVSPKKDCLPEMLFRANEIKLLVDDDFDIKKGCPSVLGWIELAKRVAVFLQPVNFEKRINPYNLKLCLKIQRVHPQFKLSVQMHKVVSDYIQEEIR